MLAAYVTNLVYIPIIIMLASYTVICHKQIVIPENEKVKLGINCFVYE
jgi:hypothetical protein